MENKISFEVLLLRIEDGLDRLWLAENHYGAPTEEWLNRERTRAHKTLMDNLADLAFVNVIWK